MKIKSSGEKIKTLRKSLNISQKELSNGIISIPMLSYIENNKVNLTAKIAFLLCKRINEISKKNIAQFDEVFKSENVQAENIMNTLIKNLKSYSTNDFIEIKFSIEKYLSIENYIKFNSIVGSYLYNTSKDIDNSLIFLEPILEDAINRKNNFLPLIIFQLQRVYNKSKQWYKSIQLFKNLNMNLIYEKEIKGYILFNFGLAFHKKNSYTKAITLYQEALNLVDKTLAKESCLNNIGYCYIWDKEYFKAIDYFRNVLKESANSKYVKILSYSNLILCGIETKNEVMIKNNINRLEISIDSICNNKRYQSYMTLGKGYLFFNDIQNAIINFEKELDLGVNIKDSHFLIEKYIFSVIELIKLYEVFTIDRINKIQSAIFKIPKNSFSNFEIVEIIDLIFEKFPKEHSSIFIKSFKNLFKNL